MSSLEKVLPDFDILMALEPEELAVLILQLIKEHYSDKNLHIQVLTSLVDRMYNDEVHAIAQRNKSGTKLAIKAAWQWLENNGLLMPQESTNGQNGFRELTLKGIAIETDEDLDRYKVTSRIPKCTLHPLLQVKVWPSLIRKEYDSAVFQAMKMVEVRVRNVAGFGSEMHGINLMRQAFHKERGPLTDPNLEPAEKEAQGQLFAGAYGYFRNPTAHRDVPIDTHNEAIETLLIANHLLRIVDAAEIRLTN